MKFGKLKFIPKSINFVKTNFSKFINVQTLISASSSAIIWLNYRYGNFIFIDSNHLLNSQVEVLEPTNLSSTYEKIITISGGENKNNNQNLNSSTDSCNFDSNQSQKNKNKNKKTTTYYGVDGLSPQHNKPNNGFFGKYAAKPQDPFNPGCGAVPKSIKVTGKDTSNKLSQSKISEDNKYSQNDSKTFNIVTHDGFETKITDKSNSHLLTNHGKSFGINDPAPINPK